MDILDEISTGLQRGEHQRVAELVERAISGDVAPATILDDGLLAGMDVVGRRFRDHEIFLPDVLLAARAMYAGLDLLKPLLQADEVPYRGTVVLGTVHGDLHDIGKNLVAIMLEGAGFRVVDLGTDVPAERFVEAAVEEKAGVIGMSALLTTTMPVMGEVVELVEQRGLKGRIHTIVGGAPVSRAWAEQIGADAHAFDAANAVERVRQLVGA